jgi:hypothetical protein
MRPGSVVSVTVMHSIIGTGAGSAMGYRRVRTMHA